MELNLCRDAEASGSLEPDSTGHVWALETLETTRALGRLLARELPTGAILLLSGPLGAGKTSLVQGLAEGLGISEAITSPTFALAQHTPRGTHSWCTLISIAWSNRPPPMNCFFRRRRKPAPPGR